LCIIFPSKNIKGLQFESWNENFIKITFIQQQNLNISITKNTTNKQKTKSNLSCF
jgi:hypothetical protein